MRNTWHELPAPASRASCYDHIDTDEVWDAEVFFLPFLLKTKQV